VKNLCINDTRFDGINVDDLAESNDKKDEDKPPVNPEKIPGIIASGWTINDYYELKKSKERSFNLQCQNIIDTLRRHKLSWPFLEPVNIEDVPDYYEYITEPIDIKAIEKKL